MMVLFLPLNARSDSEAKSEWVIPTDRPRRGHENVAWFYIFEGDAGATATSEVECIPSDGVELVWVKKETIVPVEAGRSQILKAHYTVNAQNSVRLVAALRTRDANKKLISEKLIVSEPINSTGFFSLGAWPVQLMTAFTVTLGLIAGVFSTLLKDLIAQWRKSSTAIKELKRDVAKFLLPDLEKNLKILDIYSESFSNNGKYPTLQVGGYDSVLKNPDGLLTYLEAADRGRYWPKIQEIYKQIGILNRMPSQQRSAEEISIQAKNVRDLLRGHIDKSAR